MSMNLCEREWLERMELAAKIYNNKKPNQAKSVNEFIDYMFEIYGYAHKRFTEDD